MELQELSYLLKLYHCRDIGNFRLSRLVPRFASMTALLSAGEEPLQAVGLTPEEVGAITGVADATVEPGVEAALQWLHGPRHHILTWWDEYYPRLLREIPVPPPLLFVKGDPAALSLPQIAIVGSRSASTAGKANACWIAAQLARGGFCICSGMAAGIDSAAHAGALSVNGSTVAVLGTGIDIVYPRRNQSLAERIAESGALVSEFPLGTPPGASHFPQRNRLISGCSVGVLIVEAALRSGSLITARLAVEQNREVFAMPGAITSAGSRGCHRLIKEGAKLVESPEDLLEELGAMLALQQECLTDPDNTGTPSNAGLCGVAMTRKAAAGGMREFALKSLSENEAKILKVIGGEPCHPDTLTQQCGLSVALIHSLLVKLEVDGLVEQVAGRYRRC
ncbi:MAG: DNA-processing protein DprA [Pseudohongiellaceae bacterium]